MMFVVIVCTITTIAAAIAVYCWSIDRIEDEIRRDLEADGDL